jgi:hypothetical protein
VKYFASFATPHITDAKLKAGSHELHPGMLDKTT